MERKTIAIAAPPLGAIEEARQRAQSETAITESYLEKDPHVTAFKDMVNDLMDTYSIQNAKYGTCWLKDGLDARATFVEFSAKYHRLKNMIWENWPLVKDPKYRARVQETLRDAILYLMFTARRLELEVGPTDQELIKKMVDKS